MAITPGDYAGYDSVTSKPAQVDSTETDFPYYIDLAELSTTWHSNAQTDGGDIRVTTNSDGTGQVPIEVVSIDTTAETGELHFKDSTDASSAKTYYVWCGTSTSDSQPAVTGTYGRNNVWTEYGLVWHGEDATTDSTGNNTLTNNGATSSTGQIEGAFDFDGTNDYIDTTPVITAFPFTFTFWFTTDSVSGTLFMITQQNSTNSDRSLVLITDDHLRYQLGDGTGANADVTATGLSLSTGTWYYGAAKSASSGNAQVLVNGANKVTDNVSHTFSFPFDEGTIGGRVQTGPNYYNGDIDEVRIADSELSDGWIGTEYNMQSSNSTFWTFNGWTAQEEGAEDNPMFSFGGF